jgi:battenin
MSGNTYEPLSSERTLASPSFKIPLAFWCLGLLNNASYVIMLASAKAISDGGTALVFLANCVPSLLVQLSAPYWFDKVGYHYRIVSAGIIMAAGFSVVAISVRVEWQLVGVVLVSAQCGLGEASLLALAGACDSRRNTKNCITCFSSGTGLAGVFGFLWKFVWNDWLKFTLEQTLCMAILLAVMYIIMYVKNLWDVDFLKAAPREDIVLPLAEEMDLELVTNDDTDSDRVQEQNDRRNVDDEDDSISTIQRIQDMTSLERLRLVASLYPYMIPLFLVYAAEYSLQAGTWSAIGFPVTSPQARDSFYEYSNWMYQAGVFLSRSSGTLFTAPLYILWLMPILQCINVAFFWWVAASHVFYNYWLLIPCFYVGLLGGGVYVNGYLRICADLPMEHREFSLSATSVAAAMGIVVADLTGLFLQACLYQRNGLDGAVVSCPR